MKYTFKPARPGDVLLILSAGVWGKGATLEEAKKACGWASVLRQHGFLLYSVHAETYVNDYGATVYPVTHEPIELARYQ